MCCARSASPETENLLQLDDKAVSQHLHRFGALKSAYSSTLESADEA
jgi:hypothetical protein